MPSVLRGSDDFDSEDVNIGAAKAWVNFNGTGVVAIRSSFNVSSITDNGVGDYTVNLAGNTADANYTVLGTGAGAVRITHDDATTPRTVSLFRINARTSTTDANTDAAYIDAAIFGN